MSERFEDPEDRDLDPAAETDPTPSDRPIPIDHGGGLDPDLGIVKWEVELDAEISKDGGKVRYRGAEAGATQIAAVVCVVAGGFLWNFSGWLPAVMVAIWGPAVAWFFSRRK